MKKKPNSKLKANKLTPEQKVMQEIEEACPGAKSAQGPIRESWMALAVKIAMARSMKTYVYCITPNNEILDNREILREKFGCQIQSPAESRFGLDCIDKF